MSVSNLPCVSELHLIIPHCLKQDSTCCFFSYISISYIKMGEWVGDCTLSTWKALGSILSIKNNTKKTKHFRSKHSMSSVVPPYWNFRSICGGVLIKSHWGCLEEVVSFPGKGQQGCMLTSSGIYAYGLHFYLKKRKKKNYPFSGLPLSFIAGYISHVRHKFTSVLHKPLLSCDGYCKLLTSAKPCQETEVIENSRAVGENASRIISGSSSFVGFMFLVWVMAKVA